MTLIEAGSVHTRDWEAWDEAHKVGWKPKGKRVTPGRLKEGDHILIGGQHRVVSNVLKPFTSRDKFKINSSDPTADPKTNSFKQHNVAKGRTVLRLDAASVKALSGEGAAAFNDAHDRKVVNAKAKWDALSKEERDQAAIKSWSNAFRHHSKQKMTPFEDELHRSQVRDLPAEHFDVGRAHAQHILTALRDAKPQRGQLHRGLMMTPTAVSHLTEGKRLNLDSASWSKSSTVANMFAHGEGTKSSAARSEPVVFHAEKGAQGLDISGLSSYQSEQEVISGGHFKVTGVEKRGRTTHVTVKQTSYAVRQADDLSDEVNEAMRESHADWQDHIHSGSRVEEGTFDTRDWHTWDLAHPWIHKDRHHKWADQDKEVVKKAHEDASHVPAGHVVHQSREMTDAEYREHRNHVEHELIAHGTNDLMRSPFSTHNSEDRVAGVEGAYTPERKKLHDKILAEYEERAKNVPSGRRAVIMGGLGGAGKSTVLRHEAQSPQSVASKLGIKYDTYDKKGEGVGDPNNFVTINPDDIKERMAELGKIPKVDELSPMEASAFAHEEASMLANRVAERMQSRGKNVIHDITLNSVGSGEKRINALRTAGVASSKGLGGYHVSGVMVDVSTAQSKASAEKRHRGGQDRFGKGIGQGGRYVPSDLILGAKDPQGIYRSKNRAAFETLKRQGRFDHTITIDNENYAQRVIEETGAGGESQAQIDRANAHNAAKAAGKVKDTGVSLTKIHQSSVHAHKMASGDHALAVQPIRSDERAQSDITDKILSYRRGEIRFQDLLHELGDRTYATPSAMDIPGQTMADTESRDWYEPGTFGEVTLANDQGLLSDDEYGTIHDHVMERRLGGDGNGLTRHIEPGELDTRSWAKWDEEHRPFGRGHYRRIGDHEAEEAWARGFHEVHSEHTFALGSHGYFKAETTDKEHRSAARKEAARSFTAPLKVKGKRERQLVQAYHEGRAHAHHHLANDEHVKMKGVLGLAGAYRIEPGVFDTRNWAEWDEEHKVLYHGTSKKNANEISRHGLKPSMRVSRLNPNSEPEAHVYLTDDPDRAARWARGGPKDKVAVFRVRVPIRKLSGAGSGEYAHEGPIPASQVERVRADWDAETRNWKEWDIEHPYLKHGYSHHAPTLTMKVHPKIAKAVEEHPDAFAKGYESSRSLAASTKADAFRAGNRDSLIDQAKQSVGYSRAHFLGKAQAFHDAIGTTPTSKPSGHHNPFSNWKDALFGKGAKYAAPKIPKKTPEQLAAEKKARDEAAALAKAEHARRAVLAGHEGTVDPHDDGPDSWDKRDWASRYGGVMFDPEGRVLLREPLNHFDGINWTFSKGHPDTKDEHPTQAAIRETEEETGLSPRLIGRVPGGFSGSGTGSRNHYYLMEDSGQPHDPSIMNGETQSLAWATPAQADIMIQRGTNPQGVYRDRATLRAAVAAHEKLTGIHNIQLAALGPPPEKPKPIFPKYVKPSSAKIPKLPSTSPVAVAQKAGKVAGTGKTKAQLLAEMENFSLLDGDRADPDHDPRSTMVCLDVPPGTIEPVPDGLPDTQHHITIVYAGKIDADGLQAVITAARDVAAKSAPLHGIIGGLGSFEPSAGSDGLTPYFAVPNIPGIEKLRPPLEHLNASEHTDFHPHMTLTYAEKGDEPPEPVPPTPVTFTHLDVHRGGQKVASFPFTGIRIDQGEMHVRNWAKWHAEHPYIKHPRTKHFTETEHHAHAPTVEAPKIMPTGKDLPVPPAAPKTVPSAKLAQWMAEAKEAHTFKPGSTRANRFEAGYVAARYHGMHAGLTPEAAHELSEQHDIIAKGLQANQAQAKREGVAAGYHAHSIGHGDEPVDATSSAGPKFVPAFEEEPNPYLKGSPKWKAFNDAYEHELDWAKSQNMTAAEAQIYLDDHHAEAVKTAPSKKTIDGVPVKAHHQGAAQAYKDYAASLPEKPVLEQSEVSAAVAKPVVPPIGHLGVPETEDQLNSLKKVMPGSKFSNGETVPQTGSNGGAWYDDGAGNAYFLKGSQSDEHAMNEVAGALAYKQAGIRSQDVSLVHMKDGSVRALSHYMTGLTPILGPQDTDETTRASARKGMGMDALMSHYDLTGMVTSSGAVDGPNLFKDKQGNVVRLDLGGTGRFRAQGGKKLSWKVGGWDPESMADNDYESIRSGKQGQLAYGVTKPGLDELPGDMQASLANAADFDTTKYHQAMLDAGLPESFADDQVKVIADRQEHLKEHWLGEGPPQPDESGYVPGTVEHANWHYGYQQGIESSAGPETAKASAEMYAKSALEPQASASKASYEGLAAGYAAKAGPTIEPGEAAATSGPKAKKAEDLLPGDTFEFNGGQYTVDSTTHNGAGAMIQVYTNGDSSPFTFEPTDVFDVHEPEEMDDLPKPSSDKGPSGKTLAEFSAEGIADRHKGSADYAEGYEAQKDITFYGEDNYANVLKNLNDWYNGGPQPVPKAEWQSKAKLAGRLGATLDVKHGNPDHAPAPQPSEKILGPNGSQYPADSDDDLLFQKGFDYAQTYAKQYSFGASQANASAKKIADAGVDTESYGELTKNEAGVAGLVAGYKAHAREIMGEKQAYDADLAAKVEAAKKPTEPESDNVAVEDLKAGDVIEHPSMGLYSKEMPAEVVAVSPSPSGKAHFVTTKQLETNKVGEPGKVEDHIIANGEILKKAHTYAAGTHADGSKMLGNVHPGEQYAGGYMIDSITPKEGGGITVGITGPHGGNDIDMPGDASINQAITAHEAALKGGKSEFPVGTTFTSPNSPVKWELKADGWYNQTYDGPMEKSGADKDMIESGLKSPTESWVEHPPRTSTGKAPAGTKWYKDGVAKPAAHYYEKNADGSIDFKDSNGKVLNHDTAESTEDDLAGLGWKPVKPVAEWTAPDAVNDMKYIENSDGSMYTTSGTHFTPEEAVNVKNNLAAGHQWHKQDLTPDAAQDVFGVPVTPAQAQKALDTFNDATPNPAFTGMDPVTPYQALKSALGHAGKFHGKDIESTNYQDIHDKLQEVAGVAPSVKGAPVGTKWVNKNSGAYWEKEADGSVVGKHSDGSVILTKDPGAGAEGKEAQLASDTHWTEQAPGVAPPKPDVTVSFQSHPAPNVPLPPTGHAKNYAKQYPMGYMQAMKVLQNGSKTADEVQTAIDKKQGELDDLQTHPEDMLANSKEDGMLGMIEGGTKALQDYTEHGADSMIVPSPAKSKKHNEATSVKQLAQYPNQSSYMKPGIAKTAAGSLKPGNDLVVIPTKDSNFYQPDAHTVLGITENKKDASKVDITAQDNDTGQVHVYTVPKTTNVQAGPGKGQEPFTPTPNPVETSSTPWMGSPANAPTTSVAVADLQVGDKVKVDGEIYEVTKTYGSFAPDATNADGVVTDLEEKDLHHDSMVDKVPNDTPLGVTSAAPSPSSGMVQTQNLSKGDHVLVNGKTYTVVQTYPNDTPIVSDDADLSAPNKDLYTFGLSATSDVQVVNGGFVPPSPSSPSAPQVVTSSTPLPPIVPGQSLLAKAQPVKFDSDFDSNGEPFHQHPGYHNDAYDAAYEANKTTENPSNSDLAAADSAQSTAPPGSDEAAAAKGKFNGLQAAQVAWAKAHKSEAKKQQEKEYIEKVEGSYTAKEPFEVKDEGVKPVPNEIPHGTKPDYATEASSVGYDQSIAQGYDQAVAAYLQGHTPEQIQFAVEQYLNKADAIGTNLTNEDEIMEQAHYAGLAQGAGKAAVDLAKSGGDIEQAHPNASSKSILQQGILADKSGHGAYKAAKSGNPFKDNQSATQLSFSSGQKSTVSTWKHNYRYTKGADYVKALDKIGNGQDPGTGSNAQAAKKLYALYLDKAEPNTQTFQRKVTSSGIDASTLASWQQVGNEISIPLTSWSTDPNAWNGNVWLHAPPGTVSMDIGRIENFDGEVETISGGRFIVKKVEVKGGITHIYLEQTLAEAT